MSETPTQTDAPDPQTPPAEAAPPVMPAVTPAAPPATALTAEEAPKAPPRPAASKAAKAAPPPPPPVAPPPPPARTGGAGRFAGLLLGGVAAAAAGFGLATWGARQGWPLVLPQTAALQAEVATLRDQLAGLSAAQIDPARLAAVESRLAQPQADIGALDQRLTALEQRPATAADPQVVADLKAQIGTLATRLAEQQTTTTRISAEIDSQIRQKLEGAVTEAEALQQAAERRAALLGLETALTAGLPLTDSAVRLEDAGIALPEPLAALIAAPVTLPDLQAAVPDAARQALLAARQADMGDTLADRLTTFLQTQTGARPLAPQEGDTPEAVLSRLEGHVRQGDIAAARDQIAALPPAAQQALADWAALADRYLAGRAALAPLLQE